MAKKRLPIAKTSDVAPFPYKRTKEDEARERRYRAEDALRVCEQYEKNKADKRLMADVKSLAKEKMNDLKRVVK